MGMQFSATVGIIPQWFSRRRSLANGIGTAGSGLESLIYSLATGAMIQRWGTGWAFGTNFLHAQIFTGFMFMGAAIFLWLVRAWKISEVQKTGADGDPVKREAVIRDNDVVPRKPVVARTVSRVPSPTSKAKAAKGLFTMVRV
ncbi:hypothetical protein Aspvir_003053 [Aspergillus viridinutans]|uniref:Uncharacterized protein n=1 Tax=Aspergillus viridinutans TaxID=75553 RepID=A0A9P3FAM2_ASPVI|nr:uncharacterized protein Aspvir_003053 [Aspergillus viridinutans]GIK07390.1 hypothetical protein Aspvir_003053 [Aspergillus viridinutans]